MDYFEGGVYITPQEVDYASDLLEGLRAIGYNVEVDGNSIIVFPSDSLEEYTTPVERPLPTTYNTNNGTSLLDTLKENSNNNNSYLDRQNTILENQNKILSSVLESSKIHNQLIAQQNSILSKQVEALKNQIDSLNGIAVVSAVYGNNLIETIEQKDMNTTVNNSVESPSVNITNEVAVPSINNNIDTSSIDASTTAIASTLETIANKDYRSTVNNNIDTSSIDSSTSAIASTLETIANKDYKSTVNNSITFDTTKLDENTTKLANAIEGIKESNLKIGEGIEVQKEHYEYEKTQNTDLELEQGVYMTPRQARARKDFEKFKDQKSENDFDWKTNFVDKLSNFGSSEFDEIENLFEDFFGTDIISSLDGLDEKTIFNEVQDG